MILELPRRRTSGSGVASLEVQVSISEVSTKTVAAGGCDKRKMMTITNE